MAGRHRHETMGRHVGMGLNGRCVDSEYGICYNMDSQQTIKRGKCSGCMCSAVCECVWVGPRTGPLIM